MPLSVPQRRKLALELRDVVFRGCSALGVLLGMWWMVSTPVGTTACADPPMPQADPGVVITDCARQTIIDSAAHYGLGIAGGALLGAIVGVILARMVPVASAGRPRRARRHHASPLQTVARPLLPATASAQTVGRWITARYAGRCATCSSPVQPGDRVRHRPGRVDCAGCGTS